MITYSKIQRNWFTHNLDKIMDRFGNLRFIIEGEKTLAGSKIYSYSGPYPSVDYATDLIYMLEASPSSPSGWTSRVKPYNYRTHSEWK